MSLRPGRNLVRIGAVAAVISAVTFFVPAVVWLLLAVLLAVIGLGIADYYWLRQHRSDIDVRRDLPLVVGRDVPFEIVLYCENHGTSGIQAEIRDVLPVEAEPSFWSEPLSMESGETSRELRQTFRIATRGSYEVGPIWVSLAGRFEILEAQLSIDTVSKIKVLPEGLVAKDDLSQNIAAEIQVLDRRSRSRRRSAGTEFESIAEYRPGDDPRRIDWRSTARMRRLVIRRFLVEQHQDVLLLLDCGRLMGSSAGHGTKLDCAVDAALLLARVALANGDRCGVALFDSEVLGYLPPRSHSSSFGAIVDSVYDAQSRWQETDFTPVFELLQSRQQKRSVIIVLSDLSDEETSKRMRTSLVSLTRRHVVIFAALQTPLLLDETRQPLKDSLEAARHAVAYRLLRERERTLHQLRRGNVQVLDVEPSKLTVPLINQYLELRSRNVV